MHIVAPNLGALIGDTVGARLISHAGKFLEPAPSLSETFSKPDF